MGFGKRVWLGVLGILLSLVAKAGAVDRNPQIQKAINKGVAYLKSIQTEDGWQYGGDGQAHVGASALVGLALLECDVPVDDAAVRKAAEIVRKNAPTLVHTYSLAASIWFLDRLGEEADVPLIESMAVRLLAGQKEGDGWRYTCPSISQEEVLRLTKLMNQQNVLKGSKDLPKQPKGQEQKNPGKRRQIAPEIQNQLKNLARPPALGARPAAQAGNGLDQVFAAGDRMGDNSNTQFAALGLWVARRYGMPVDDALARVEARFRNTQFANGGWNYIPVTGAQVPPNWTFYPSMTCAGLIGLAVGHGVALEAAKEGRARKHIDAEKDPNISLAFQNLAAALQDLSGVSAFRDRGDMRFYFLWSLERVGEVYGLETIGKRNWYDWGSRVLLNSQNRDGSWVGEYSIFVRGPDGNSYHAAPDTCFALLFLSRANVAKDLSISLRGRIKDAGHQMKAIANLADLQKKKDAKVAGSADKKPSKSEADIPSLEDPKTKNSPPPDAGENADEETRTARKMSSELIDASGDEQDKLLEKYKQSKGAVYTLALAGAIPQLSDTSKDKARDALAERLTRMTAATLRAELKEEDPEIRRAASLACAMKEEKGHIPDLIPLLEDREPMVGRAAHAALKSLTNQDFGPDRDASPAERTKAVADWKAWWQKQSEK
jgi:hypothetical protein